MTSKLFISAVVFAAGSAFGQTFQIGGTSGFIQDLDNADGADLVNGLIGTWNGLITVPDVSSLTFVSNSQSQGGSFTRYSGVVLESLSLSTAFFGDRTVTNTPITGTITLWDRRNFGSGQHQIQMDWTIGTTSIGFDFVATNGTASSYNNLFNVGTPGPNTLSDFNIPQFANAGERVGVYNSVSVSVDGNLPILPGRGRYNGDTTLFAVPAPGALGVLAGAGLLAARRRR
jgi:hypothetical protein